MVDWASDPTTRTHNVPGPMWRVSDEHLLVVDTLIYKAPRSWHRIFLRKYYGRFRLIVALESELHLRTCAKWYPHTILFIGKVNALYATMKAIRDGARYIINLLGTAGLCKRTAGRFTRSLENCTA